MQRVADLYISQPEEWHDRTAHHWAGDCILGTALAHAGVPFTWAWPMFQGGNPADMDWTEAKDERKLWCAPALSYHHFEPHEIESMWAFEQQRISVLAIPPPKRSFFGGRDTVLHHSDVFKQRVMPKISQVRDDWTNASPDLVEHSARIVKPAEARLEECQAISGAGVAGSTVRLDDAARGALGEKHGPVPAIFDSLGSVVEG
ncbi:hypothetical protein LTR97_002107 [Elasticomyces elasticus]|uniref:Uncharacterized protein n=1 Tax=Elasticomyces elasticus TaxID=574655 RepID=A0AAN7WPG7_9PEZI|nr:hypothetical protein LTR97_002107 [Elasticomyces elasticus]